MAVLVREARDPRERDAACAVMRSVYAGEGFTAPEQADAVMRPDVLMDAGELLVATSADGVIRGAVLFLHPDSALRQLAREGEREFRLLAVHPDARGRGVGEALVQACIERAARAALVLWTQPRMTAAHRLYERLGFTRHPARDIPDVRGFMRLVYVRAPLPR